MTIITELKREDFDNVLKNYAIGRYKSHKHIDWALQNTVYLVNTTGGKYILKIFEQSGIDFIKFQVRIIDYLASKGIPVAKISKSSENKDILFYKNKLIIIQKFLLGNKPEEFDSKLTKNIATIFSLMSRYLLKLKLKGKYVWRVDHQFKPNKDKRVSSILGINFKDAEKNLLQQLRKINRKKLRKSVIHGDFHGPNLLVKDNKLNAIIDWDDCHEDYLAYEIAVFIMDSFVTEKKADKEQIKIFFREYQKNLKLMAEEKKAIYYFVKQRFLGVIFWIYKQTTKHKDLAKQLEKRQKRVTKCYFNFEKISLEEFLKLS